MNFYLILANEVRDLPDVQITRSVDTNTVYYPFKKKIRQPILQKSVSIGVFWLIGITTFVNKS